MMKCFVIAGLLACCLVSTATAAILGSPIEANPMNCARDGEEQGQKRMETCMKFVMEGANQSSVENIQELLGAVIGASEAGAEAEAKPGSTAVKPNVEISDETKALFVQMFLCLTGQFVKQYPEVAGVIWTCAEQSKSPIGGLPSEGDKMSCEEKDAISKCVTEKITEICSPSAHRKRDVSIRALHYFANSV